jgi:glycine oxidase
VRRLSIGVIGGGVMGLWQGFTLAGQGHAVTLYEAGHETGTGAASRLAGAMLAPYCESEAAEPIIVELGLRGLELWRAAYPGVVAKGSLVVAAPRDQGELTRFARMTDGHRLVDGPDIGRLEPDLADRFSRGLYYAEEAHVAPRSALAWLVGEVRRLGGVLEFGAAVEPRDLVASYDAVVDCRGIAARADLAQLRGVRGEMVLIRTDEIALSRPARLLHPRFPIYVVPWGEGLYMVGATVIEREDAGPVTVRSALELLGTAYALHPAFGEAEIVELSAGVRPALPDNMPRIVVRGRHISVNGAHRHGFLLAPVLAELTQRFLTTGATDARVFVSEGQNG